jgi:prepilin-type processing-associated H-X9-DG protein
MNALNLTNSSFTASIKSSQVNSPAGAVYFAESYRSDSGTGNYNISRQQGNGWPIQNASIFTTTMIDSSLSYYGTRSFMFGDPGAPTHGTPADIKVNGLMVDGHVELLSKGMAQANTYQIFKY